MRVAKLFIFCLLFTLFLFSPLILLAAQKVMILELTVSESPAEDNILQNSLNQISQMIQAGEFVQPVSQPQVVNEVMVAEFSVVFTVSGSLEAGITLTIS